LLPTKTTGVCERGVRVREEVVRARPRVKDGSLEGMEGGSIWCDGCRACGSGEEAAAGTRGQQIVFSEQKKVYGRQAAGELVHGHSTPVPDESQTPRPPNTAAAGWTSVSPRFGTAFDLDACGAGDGRAEGGRGETQHGNLHMPPDCCERSSGCGRDVRSFGVFWLLWVTHLLRAHGSWC
jgi:hypothetical protein